MFESPQACLAWPQKLFVTVVKPVKDTRPWTFILRGILIEVEPLNLKPTVFLERTMSVFSDAHSQKVSRGMSVTLELITYRPFGYRSATSIRQLSRCWGPYEKGEGGSVGNEVGDLVGNAVGIGVWGVGTPSAPIVGNSVGALVGRAVGSSVGGLVGWLVG